ncbi:MAG: tRNA preQ1(34) S-adenosylmethionine ribosyltransferase-isomerase QueA [Planctomycetota bacterium]
MKTSLFDYHLPRELIAQHPVTPRDRSKLLVLERASGKITHRHFFQIINYLQAGDVLILNNTRVLPVRLTGERTSGGLVEVLLIKEKEPGIWESFVQANHRLKENEVLFFTPELSGKLIERQPDRWLIKFNRADILALIDRIGQAPLPPYIKRDKQDDPYRQDDRKKYQTVYAAIPGAIAAPTAGLHFTKPLLTRLKKKGIQVVYLTLHTGLGTFKPIKTDEIAKHRMEREYFEVKPETIKTITRARLAKKRIIAVGTTVCRVLETIAGYTALSLAHPWNAHSIIRGVTRGSLLRGWTDIFIYPPDPDNPALRDGTGRFKLVDGLITNFHLPRGTPLLLVSAFAGRDKILAAYEEAIKEKYRFYSYGDAMLIL